MIWWSACHSGTIDGVGLLLSVAAVSLVCVYPCIRRDPSINEIAQLCKDLLKEQQSLKEVIARQVCPLSRLHTHSYATCWLC